MKTQEYERHTDYKDQNIYETGFHTPSEEVPEIEFSLTSIHACTEKNVCSIGYTAQMSLC